MIIAIDGPAASGKSSTAKAVADALGFRHIDSGSLYRALTAARARRGGASDAWTEREILDLAATVSLSATRNGFEPCIGGVANEQELRSDAVTGAVSRVAQMPGARAWVNARILDAAKAFDVVVDGRDMGTAVFPAADLKVYLVADSWERARRRMLQRGVAEPPDQDIAAEMIAIVARDARDATQSVQAADAIVIDTSNITQAEQIAHIVALAQRVQTR